MLGRPEPAFRVTDEALRIAQTAREYGRRAGREVDPNDLAVVAGRILRDGVFPVPTVPLLVADGHQQRVPVGEQHPPAGTVATELLLATLGHQERQARTCVPDGFPPTRVGPIEQFRGAADEARHAHREALAPDVPVVMRRVQLEPTVGFLDQDVHHSKH